MDRRRSRFVTHIDTEIICVESYKTYSTGVPKVTILFRGPEETLVGTNARDKVLNVYPGLYSIDYKISSKGNITILSAEPIN